MLDKRTEAMLQAANALTAEDLEVLRGTATVAATATDISEPAEADGAIDSGEAPGSKGTEITEPNATSPQLARAAASKQPPPQHVAANAHSRGEYERQRTRESKVSTTCLGNERQKHDWWPVGTELVGRIGPDTFTAVVVENPAVKSGRSMRITSGPAAGRICITPTRAAIEATEDYRQTHNMGCGGGITNGWEFWQPVRT